MRTRFRDLIIAPLLLLLIATLGLTARERAAEIQRRIVCATNLRQIGQALRLYADENGGKYPRTIYSPTSPPTWGTPYEANPKLGAAGGDTGVDPFAADGSPNAPYRPSPNDVTAALYRVMRTQEIASPSFVCPSALGLYWQFGGGTYNAIHWTNWAGESVLRESLSYSYQNPYPSQDAVKKGFKFDTSLPARFVLAADMNPGVDALLHLNVDSAPSELRRGNSLNHNLDGQNVLFADGHIEFCDTPFCGQGHDNVFTYGPSGDDRADKGGDGIDGSPSGPNDSILLPTACALKMVTPEGTVSTKYAVARPSVKKLKVLHDQLNGTYSDNGRQLDITDDTLELLMSGRKVRVSYTIDLYTSGRIGLAYTGKDGKSETLIVRIESDHLQIGAWPFGGTWKRQ